MFVHRSVINGVSKMNKCLLDSHEGVYMMTEVAYWDELFFLIVSAVAKACVVCRNSNINKTFVFTLML